VLPPPDAIVVAPATFNTINKWAAGISDTLALGLLTKAIGKRLPVVALPFVNAAQAEHPAFQGSIERMRAAGMQLLYGPNVLELHEPAPAANFKAGPAGGHLQRPPAPATTRRPPGEPVRPRPSRRAEAFSKGSLSWT
jgi:Flavoprotein